ncbi:protein kinase domain-containing protein [Kushneria sp. TE3]|uniref:protein kinase domain-containing protein n=1 Tax=Kushneria sp. TE3 TaxID=3449832 RepID=UPI003F6843F8
MSVQVPDNPRQLEIKGACAIIADSTWRNAIARQAGDISVRGFLADYYSTPDHWDIKTSATRVLRALNGWCYSQSRYVQGGSYISSLSAIIFRGRESFLFHMGDTLVFRLRGAEFEQLSRDHVTDLGGYRYPSRALGMDNNIDIDHMSLPLKTGDVFLFTSQAVRGTLTPTDYVHAIRQQGSDLDAACERLAAMARERAGARGYGAEAFCFQLVRVDTLPDEETGPPVQFPGQLPIPAELDAGDRLDGFLIESIISKTARAHVYGVRDETSLRRMVMKVPGPEMSSRNPYLEHFLLQQWIGERVRSPFVVRIVTPPRPRRHLYYLMRPVEGQSLDRWLEQNFDAGLERRLDIARQLARAVHALHRRDILHQAICPENIMIDEHEQVVLIDFGACARRLDDDNNAALALARDGGLGAHSAPEYALGLGVSRRSDQYSLASTIYWLLTGAMPYDIAPNTLESEQALSGLTYRCAREINAQIPAPIDEALARALSPRRALRFRRLSELIQTLRHGAALDDDEDDDVSPPGEKTQDVPSRQKALRLWQGIAAALLLLLVAVMLIK